MPSPGRRSAGQVLRWLPRLNEEFTFGAQEEPSRVATGGETVETAWRGGSWSGRSGLTWVG